MQQGTRENTDNREAGKSEQESLHNVKNGDFGEDDFLNVAGCTAYDRCIWFKPAEIWMNMNENI